MRKQLAAIILALVLALSLAPVALAAPAGVAKASTQSVEVDGTPVEFQMYALVDANGGETNYVKLRDVAHVLNSTPARFSVGWDGAINLVPGEVYTDNGSEMSTPFSGDRSYAASTAETRINGAAAQLDAIELKDDQGGAYTYYKLRDLGTALGFHVDWTSQRGVFIETGAASAPEPTAPTAPSTPTVPETLTLSSAPIYEDSNIKINFVRLEKSRYGSDEAVLTLDVDNKTMQPVTVQCDAVNLDGYCFNYNVMSSDISANSIGTAEVTLEDMSATPVDLDKVQTVGGQFRIFPGGTNGNIKDMYIALFPAKNIYTGATDNTIPSAGNRTALYSDSKIELYFDHAENDGSDELEVYLLARNKTAKTLLIQNDTVTVDRRSYNRTIMSSPVLPYSTGIVRVSVRDYTGPAASSVTTVGGEFRIIDDNDTGDTYTATLGNISSVGSDGGVGSGSVGSGSSGGTGSSGDSGSSGGGSTVESDGMLLNTSVSSGSLSMYEGLLDDVPDFGALYGVLPDPNSSDFTSSTDASYYYYFRTGPDGVDTDKIALMYNDYRRHLSADGFVNPLGTHADASLLESSASDMFSKNTDNGRLNVLTMYAHTYELDFAFFLITVSYS